MTEERFKALEEKVEKILTIVSSIDANTTPCEGKQTSNAAAMGAMLKVLENSPLAKNPMIQDLIKPIKEMITR